MSKIAQTGIIWVMVKCWKWCLVLCVIVGGGFFCFFGHFSHHGLMCGSLCHRYQTHLGCVLSGYTRPTDRPGISGSNLGSQPSFGVLLTGLFSLCSFLSAHSMAFHVLLPLSIQPPGQSRLPIPGASHTRCSTMEQGILSISPSLPVSNTFFILFYEKRSYTCSYH